MLLLLATSAILLSCASAAATPPDPKKSDDLDDDEDLSFLEEGDEASGDHLHASDHGGDEDEADDAPEDFDPSAFDGHDESPPPAVDEKDVVVLTDGNFSKFIEEHRHVLVEFYAPWCGHCQALAPEFAAAATELKAAGEDAVLAKVDATEENELAQKYEIQGYPTVLFFVDGLDNRKTYTGQRTK